MIKRMYTTLFLILLLPQSQTCGKNFIFDFNGVLMGTNTVASLKKIGMLTIMKCMVHLQKGPSIDRHLKTKLFEILEKIAAFHELDTTKSHYACDEDGNELPYFMRAWLDGSMTCYEIRKYTLHAINSNPEWFCHTAEKKAVCNLITMLFTPKQFAETRTIHRNCITFIKACKKRGHKIFALSNWDKESFALLQEKYPDVFGLFDGIVISGEVNALKPSPDIYTLLLNRYHLEPHSCWFIDDQKENVATATSLGINSILCTCKGKTKKPDFHNVTHTIKTMALERQNSSCEKTTATYSL